MRFARLPYYRRNLEILDETLHDSLAVYGDSFLTDVFSISNANNNSGCIVFLFSYAVAMFKHVNGIGNLSYFLFDTAEIVAELQMGK